ncbi:hypothetical protein KR054_010138, partial [Drosophila jambulina]
FSSVSQSAVVFKLTNLVCESYNKSWFQFHECRLKAVSREKVVLNANGTVFHSVNNIFVHANVYKRESGYKPWLIKYIFDGCRFMRKKYSPAARLLYNFMKEFTSINHTCPYGPQFVKGLYLKPELLLLPFPTGDYMLSLKWFFDQKLQFDTNISFVFVEDI